jgi:hypothetical protein
MIKRIFKKLLAPLIREVMKEEKQKENEFESIIMDSFLRVIHSSNFQNF